MGLLKKVFKTVKKVAFAATPLALVKKPSAALGVVGKAVVPNRAKPAVTAPATPVTPVAAAKPSNQPVEANWKKKPAYDASIMI